MIPLRDDQPTFSTPYITYFLIALNVVIYLFQWQVSLQSPAAERALVFQFAAVPSDPPITVLRVNAKGRTISVSVEKPDEEVMIHLKESEV